MALDMKVTGLIVQSATKYELRGTPLNGSSLTVIKVTKDTNGPPPLAGKVTGTLNGSQTIADITQASTQVWNEVNQCLASIPFRATVINSGSNITDLTCGPLATQRRTRQEIAGDVRRIRELAERLAARFLPADDGETKVDGHTHAESYSSELAPETRTG